MPILFDCVICGQTLRAKTEYAGRLTRCPVCETESHIPEDDCDPTPTGIDLSATKPKWSNKSHSSGNRDAPTRLPAKKKKKSARKAGFKENGSGFPFWLIITGSSLIVLALVGVFLGTMNAKNSLPPKTEAANVDPPKIDAPKPNPPKGQAVAQEQAFIKAETDPKWGKYIMKWEMPAKWTQESRLEDGIWPWAHMQGQGQKVRLACNRSFTENASTMTAIGGFKEMLMTAHTVRVGKLQAENTDYVETRPETHQGKHSPVIWSDFEYKGIFSKAYGIRCTIPGPKFPCTLTMECSQSTLDKWRPVLLHIAGSVTFARTDDKDDGPPVMDLPADDNLNVPPF